MVLRKSHQNDNKYVIKKAFEKHFSGLPMSRRAKGKSTPYAAKCKSLVSKTVAHHKFTHFKSLGWQYREKMPNSNLATKPSKNNTPSIKHFRSVSIYVYSSCGTFILSFSLPRSFYHPTTPTPFVSQLVNHFVCALREISRTVMASVLSTVDTTQPAAVTVWDNARVAKFTLEHKSRHATLPLKAVHTQRHTLWRIYVFYHRNLFPFVCFCL